MLANTQAWTGLITGTHIIVVLLLAVQVYRNTTGWPRFLGGVILIPWLASAVLIAQAGIVEDMTSVLSPLGMILTVMIAGGLGLLLLWEPVKRIVDSLPLRWLMGIQVYRVLGIVFLFGWLSGELPMALGPLTAFNDVFIGVSAPFAAWAASRGRYTRWVRLWNVYGLLDFVYAIMIGVMAAPHAFQLLQLTPDTRALGLLPLSLISLWAVPLSTLLHVASLRRLSVREPTPVETVRATA